MIEFRSSLTSRITRFDIPVIEKPPNTESNDFMVLQIMTTINQEPIPNVPGWIYVGHVYTINLSHFVFAKTATDDEKYFNVIRKVRGFNRLTVSSYKNLSDNPLVPDLNTVTYVNIYDKKFKYDLSNFYIELKDGIITSTNNINNSINFYVKESIPVVKLDVAPANVKEEVQQTVLLRAISKNLASTMNPHIIVSPKKVQKGDLMIMQINYSHNTNVTKLSHGWKLLQEYKTDTIGMNVYYKIASRKEPASYLIKHSGDKNCKLLVAIAAFYSPNDKPIRVLNSAIQYNELSTVMEYPAITVDDPLYSKLYLSVRDLESSLRIAPEYTLLWDYEKKLRTTGLFTHSFGDINSVESNLGASITAVVCFAETEPISVSPPDTPTGFVAKRANGTIIKLNKSL